MSLRTGWKFTYTVAVVAAAALLKEQYHLKREAYWLERYNQAFQKMETDGVKLQKVPRLSKTQMPRAMAYETAAYSNTRANVGVDLRVTLDQTLQELISRYQQKYELHKEYVNQYRGFRMTLESRPDQDTLELDLDDILWFGLHGSRVDDEPDDEEISDLEEEAGLKTESLREAPPMAEMPQASSAQDDKPKGK